MAELLFSQVRDTRLHEDVGRQLARRIVRGDIPAGAFLPAEGELLAKFGVSRAVIREALRRLEACGMIVVRHGRRTTVAPPADWDVLDSLVLTSYWAEGQIAPLVEDALRVRRLLEPAVAAEAAQRAHPELLADLAASLERQEAALTAPDRFLEEDVAFHHLLALATGNRILLRLLAALGVLLRMSRALTNQLPQAIPDALRWHRRVYEAVRDGDAARARQAMAAHLGVAADRWPDAS